MSDLFAQLPAIISEAAKSPLGIFALMIISLAILGFFFFKEATEKTRIAIFVMLFVGVAVFGLSLVRTTSAAAPAADAEAVISSIRGTWTADVVYVSPRSFRESFTFETVGDMLVVTPTYLGSPRTALKVRAGNGAIRFDIMRQEINGDATTDIVSTYIGAVYPDRIDFLLRHDNGDPEVRFQARRADPPRP